MKNAPKTMLNQIRLAGGGAGFSLPSSGLSDNKPEDGNVGGIGVGERLGGGALEQGNRVFDGEITEGIGGVSGETQTVKSQGDCRTKKSR